MTIAIKNKWQIKYQNICQELTKMVDNYAVKF